MTRFDRHVAAVQRRLLLRQLAEAFSWALLVVALGAVLAVAVDRLFAVALPARWWPWVLGIALLAAVKVSVVVALVGRATPVEAAAAIDASLGLKERFSTAVFARSSSDPFARAAVRDAEATAEHVDLGRRFAVALPRRAYAAGAVAVIAVAAGLFAPRVDLFGRQAVADARVREDAARVEAHANVRRALAVVSGAPSWRNEEELGRLVDDLKGLAALPNITDPAAANRKALRAIELSRGTTADRRAEPRGDGAANDKPPTGKTSAGGQDASADSANANPADRRQDDAGGAVGPAKVGDASGTDGKVGRTNGGDRPTIAGDRLKPDAALQPQQGKQGGANASGGQSVAGNAAAGGNAAGGRDATAGGVANNAAGGGIAAAGDRSKATVPFSVVPQKSPSQDIDGGRILARDLVPAPARAGESKTKLTDAAAAARQAATDDVDADHVSGPAQGAARKYFRTIEGK